eukprot:symbB.v1.2.000477.t1/scaffold11.1/size528188/26
MALGSIDVSRILVPYSSKEDLSFGLLLCCCFSGSADLILLLIEVGANVNELFRPTWGLWLIFQISKMQNRRQPSKLSTLAQNYSGATPLMCSILSGAFEAAAILLAAGARVDLCNSKKKTADDLAKEALAPQFLIDAIAASKLKTPSRNSLEFARYYWEASQPSTSATV